MKILITGISGSGKTTVLDELKNRGKLVIDLDSTGICRWKNKETKEFVEYSDNGETYEWLTKHGWYCDIDMFKKLLLINGKDEDVFVAGISENIEELTGVFDKVLILKADDSKIKERLNTRSNNDFAKSDEEQNFVLKHSSELLGKIRSSVEIDANKIPKEVVDSILNDV